MKKTLFVLITSLLFQSNAFSGGNTGLKRDRDGNDAGVTLEEIIVHDTFNQLNL